MKKLLLFVLLVASLSSPRAIGQSFTLTSDTVFSYVGTTVDLHNKVNNITSNYLLVNWNVVPGLSNLATGWDPIGTSICDNMTCYSWSNVSGGSSNLSDTIHAGNFMDLKVSFDATSAAIGTESWITLHIVDANNSANTKNTTFRAQKAALGVVNVTKSDDNVVLFPNPARSNVNVVFDASLGVKNIAIYNLIGKAVSVYKVNGTSAKLDLDNVPSGIYFVRLINAQGQIVATRKFTHQ